MKLKNLDIHLVLPNLEKSYQDSPHNSIVQGKSSTSTILLGGGSDESILFLIFFFFLSFFVLFLKKASPGRDYPPNMRKTKCILFSGILIVLFGNRKYWKKILWPLEDKYMQMTCKDIWIHVRNNHRGQDTAGFRWHKSIKPCISE